MSKNILFLLLLNVSHMLSAQQAGNKAEQLVASEGANTSIRIRCGTRTAQDPLFVINGEVADKKELESIDPNQITSVSILKDAKGQALYGCRALNGVVIIQLKPGMLCLQARNSYTGELIPAAQLQVRVNEQKSSKPLNENGTLELSSYYYKSTALEISASGYTTSRHLVGKGGPDTLLVLLEPVARLLPEVIVKGVQDTRICSYTISCGVAGVSICSMSVTDNKGKKDAGVMGVVPTARLYPNPASAGSQLKIQLPVAVSGSVSLALYGLNGQLIKQVVDKSNTGQLIFSLPSAFKGAGILLAQDETKNIIMKEKIVIQ
ncbi:MAG: T9SS type A sorting domain-containing protein [Chitinophagaceae bacterium]|nr:T9SS type A sorting domain-containing protein [Chitinophagaceae bacterium]